MFSLFFILCSFFTHDFCDRDHHKDPISPCINVILITQRSTIWTVRPFGARFRITDNPGPATSAATLTNKPRASGLCDSKHKKGCFMSSDIKIKVQSFGRFLSNMVMPNIGAFIAWGIITALFIPTGWLPNETLAKLVGPMITYLLPLLIGFTGGRLVGGDRGGVVGAITTMGVIVGADMPMFLGAMIAGPLGGFCIKKFDAAVDGKIKSGFEMLVNNFSAGIIGMILAILAFLGIGPAVEVLSKVLSAGVNFMVVHDMLPLASIFVEPAKILFLNNAINHGIFSPLGIQQSHDIGKSIFFLIEANPGPGMGVLLAYMFFGRGSAKQSAGGAAIIHFLGGIHEIYFPYVLMNPRLLLAVILGGMTGVFTLSVLNGGLVSPASPGSILAVLAMTPKGAYFANLTAIFAALIVSFVIASILLKTSKVKEEDEDIEAATRRMQDMKAQSKGATPLAAGDVTNDLSHVRKIIVACDAGMGSSAMGAGVLRKKVQDAGLTNISVTNSAINSLPSDVDLVITHRDLTERAMRQAPQAQHISLTNFLDSGLYTGLTERLVAAQRHNDNQTKVNSSLQDSFDASNSNLFKLGAENIFLGRKASNKEEAIRFAGEQLVKGGYVQPEYVDAMLEREKLTPTYLGESIAVPHGTVEAKDRVLKTGVVFCQYPEGVRFGEGEEDIARLVIGIAARNNEHIQVITSLTNALDDETVIERLAHTTSVEEVLALIGK
ncbi:Mannitol-specific phosphotransferase enzyme IIA component [Enterobacter sp. FY-07]|nr:Mannitol-specific phosphotransferase enzyme IIA component [Enterobacter sp. FY-07]